MERERERESVCVLCGGAYGWSEQGTKWLESSIGGEQYQARVLLKACLSETMSERRS